MTATTRRAGSLRPDDRIHVEHQHEPGTPCYCRWETDAVVDTKRLVAGLIAVEWHTEGGTTGITVVNPDTRIRFLGHFQAAA